MLGGRELNELIEESSELEENLPKFLDELKRRIAESCDQQEREVLGGLVGAMENFLSLNLSEGLLEFIPEEGSA